MKNTQLLLLFQRCLCHHFRHDKPGRWQLSVFFFLTLLKESDRLVEKDGVLHCQIFCTNFLYKLDVWKKANTAYELPIIEFPRWRCWATKILSFTPYHHTCRCWQDKIPFPYPVLPHKVCLTKLFSSLLCMDPSALRSVHVILRYICDFALFKYKCIDSLQQETLLCPRFSVLWLDLQPCGNCLTQNIVSI